MPWNFGDMLDAIEPALPPETVAYIHGDRVITWGETSRRTNNVARALIKRGAQTGDKIAIYMRNRPEYMESLVAGWKARLTHVNVNYRYTAEEVFYIFDNSDATVVAYHSEFRDNIAQIKDRLPKVRTFVEVTDDGAAPADFAESFDALAAEGDGSPLGIERSPDDQFFIYTGGTTGMPKGVIWTHNDLREITLSAARKLGPVPETVEEHAAAIRANGPGMRAIPAPPMMHGTGLLTGMAALLAGGSVVTLTNPTFDAEELLQAIHDHKPSNFVVVGDSFSKPIVAALKANPGRWDVSSVASIVSSGVMWSQEVKEQILEFMPGAILSDGYSSSEAIGLGSSVMAKGMPVTTAKFVIGDRCKVFDENDQEVQPGSGVRGMVALAPPLPLGYYKDEEKTAKTFRVIDGVRYSFPGDWCTVAEDGTLTLLGRGSACINTAGEKVFPEEVEEALKLHPSVEDALVVGLPDEKWGSAVTGVVRLAPGHHLDEDALRRHVREKLAGYKVPKRVFTGNVSLRAPNGKADYKSALEFAQRSAELREPA